MLDIFSSLFKALAFGFIVFLISFFFPLPPILKKFAGFMCQIIRAKPF